MPYPIVFGAITDSACIVWEEKCGSTGNCWLYDADLFRKLLHGSALGFMMVGTLFDIGIIMLSSRIGNLYEDEDEDDEDDQEEHDVDQALENSQPAGDEVDPGKVALRVNLNSDSGVERNSDSTGRPPSRSSLTGVRRMSETWATDPISHS